MSARSFISRPTSVLGALVLTLAALACSSGSGNAPLLGAANAGQPTEVPAAPPEPTATPVAQGLKLQAERQQLPRLSQPLADLIRAQPWYNELSQPKYNLIASILKTEQAAKAKGEPKSAFEMLSFVAEQGWYQDGFDDPEAAGLVGVFDAYTRSLTKEWAPPVGSMISSTIKYQLFRVVHLPETGDKVVVVASQDENLGRRALDLAVENLPRVEAIVGKFPYSFLYFEVAKDLPEYLAGTAYDEFITLASNSVDAVTIIHEVTHSTVYGLFPIWFEEGLAYFMESYLTDNLARDTAAVPARVRASGAPWLDVRAYGYYTDSHYLAEIGGGFLVLKTLFDIEGIEGVGKTVRALRTRTYNDQELLSAIMQQAPEDKQPDIRRLYCDRIIGTARNYCTAG